MVALLDIPSTAIAAGVFNTLVAALGAADLVDALSGEGPFTVFAPTDDAFAALPQELVSCLLEPDNKGALQSILTYHVVSGQVLSTDLTDGMTATTLQGEDVTVDLSDGVMINDSEVVMADILTTNGVIHVIDAVLVPP
ncbi:beta-Ig-H3/fasciclin, partial [Fragilariopsis cylindrus CCMP1102]